MYCSSKLGILPVRWLPVDSVCSCICYIIFLLYYVIHMSCIILLQARLSLLVRVHDGVKRERYFDLGRHLPVTGGVYTSDLDDHHRLQQRGIGLSIGLIPLDRDRPEG
jgi:hypothetical protein